VSIVPDVVPAKGRLRKSTRPKRLKMDRMRRREAMYFYLFVSPFFIGFLFLTIGPILGSLLLSFTRWNMFLPPQWVGLQNFSQVLSGNSLFWTALGNTGYYALISVPLGIILALFIAVLLNQNIVLRRWFRAAFYLPSTIPTVAVVLLWLWLLAPAGLFNEFIGLFGIKGPAWFVDPSWVKPGLILMGLWGAGGGTVLFLAGMQGIPPYLYEASALDGAGPIRQFFTVTIPMLSPIILFNVVNGLIGSFQVFTQVYILGTNNADLMMVPYLFQEAFDYFNMGYASAIAWCLFVIIIAITMVVLRWSAVYVYYEGEVRR